MYTYSCHAHHTVLVRIAAKRRPVEQLEEAKLEHMATEIGVVKGSLKALVILIRKPRDQIQMHVDVAHLMDALGGGNHRGGSNMPRNRTKRPLVCALQTDLKLDLAFWHP